MSQVHELIRILIQIKQQPIRILKAYIFVAAASDDSAPGFVDAVVVMSRDHALQISAVRIIGPRPIRQPQSGIIRSLHPFRDRDSAQPQGGGSHVHMVDRDAIHISRISSCRARSSFFSADQEGNLYGLLIWSGFAELSVKTVHVAVVAEKQDVRMLHQAGFIQAIDNSPYILIDIFHHRVISGQFPCRLLTHGRNRRHIGTEANLRGKVPRLIPGRGYIGIVRGLYGHNGKKRRVAVLLFPQILIMRPVIASVS